MQLISDFFRQKAESYRWLLSQIESILRHTHLKANEFVASEHRKLETSLSGLNVQQIGAHLSEYSAKHNKQHLIDLIQLIVTSLQSLSQALTRVPSQQIPRFNFVFQNPVIQQIPRSEPQPIPRPSNSQKIQPVPKPTYIPVQISQFGGQAKKSIRNQKLSPQTLSKTEQRNHSISQESPKIKEMSDFQKNLGENYNALKQLYNKEGDTNEACAQKCLKLDNKIYEEANDYLISLRQKQNGNQLQRTLLSPSPQKVKSPQGKA